jgi:hypothetical protein
MLEFNVITYVEHIYSFTCIYTIIHSICLIINLLSCDMAVDIVSFLVVRSFVNVQITDRQNVDIQIVVCW